MENPICDRPKHGVLQRLNPPREAIEFEGKNHGKSMEQPWNNNGTTWFPSTNPGVFGCFLKHAKHGARPAMFADYEAVVPILIKLLNCAWRDRRMMTPEKQQKLRITSLRLTYESIVFRPGSTYETYRIVLICMDQIHPNTRWFGDHISFDSQKTCQSAHIAGNFVL